MHRKMKGFVRAAAVRLTANRRAQNALEWTVSRLNFLRGIGAGAYVESSGEAVLPELLHSRGTRGPTEIFDVGANSGQFAQLLSTRIGTFARVHCFEPGQKPFDDLVARFGADPRFTLNQWGLGSTAGTAVLNYDVPGSGLASLYRRNLKHKPELALTRSESVKINTIDAYCAQKEISRIDLLKIDVEGHELQVLLGGRRMLTERRVDIVSFEFGGCNIDSRTYFQDFWDFFMAIEGFSLFRLTPSGYMAPVAAYTELQEQFGVTNYVALLERASGL